MKSFSRKIVKITGIIIACILLVLLFLKAFKVILLVISGILVATFYLGIASFIKSKLPVSQKFAVVISLLLILGTFIGIFFLLFPRISDQLESLQQQLPQAIDNARQYTSTGPIGDFIDEQFRGSQKKIGEYSQKITSLFSSFLGGLTNVYIIFFLGLFFMFQPELYIKGFISLFPKSKRERMNEVIGVVGYTLKRWLIGKLFSMLIVGILSGLGLYFLGIPLALTLGIFAALITFIPNFGPIISLVPAVLLALVKGLDYAFYVFILYVAIQAIESNLITPLIQRKMISFPMAMVLIAQVTLGIFTGLLGIILAVPIVAIIIVIVKMIYIEDILNDTEVTVKGEEKYT